MGANELKKANEHFYDEVFRRHNVDAIDELLAGDFVEHTPAPGQATDRQGAKDFIGQVLQAFPDLEVEIENEIAEGDTVSAVVRMTGTRRADFVGIPATGCKVSVYAMDVTRVRDGRFSDHWGLADMDGLMAQLGVTLGGR